MSLVILEPDTAAAGTIVLFSWLVLGLWSRSTCRFAARRADTLFGVCRGYRKIVILCLVHTRDHINANLHDSHYT